MYGINFSHVNRIMTVRAIEPDISARPYSKRARARCMGMMPPRCPRKRIRSGMLRFGFFATLLTQNSLKNPKVVPALL